MTLRLSWECLVGKQNFVYLPSLLAFDYPVPNLPVTQVMPNMRTTFQRMGKIKWALEGYRLV
jgi:hypothetical protein